MKLVVANGRQQRNIHIFVNLPEKITIFFYLTVKYHVAKVNCKAKLLVTAYFPEQFRKGRMAVFVIPENCKGIIIWIVILNVL